MNAAILESLEVRFADNPLSVDILRELAEAYNYLGVYSQRSLSVYEKACIAFPQKTYFAESISLCVFFSQLRRFTIENADIEDIDLDGVRDGLLYLQQLIRKIPNSPDAWMALGDLQMLKGNFLLAVGTYENARKNGFVDFRPMVRTYEKVAELYTVPPAEKAYFANLYSQLGLRHEAIRVYREVVGQGFGDYQSINNLITLLRNEVGIEVNVNATNSLNMEITELLLQTGDRSAALDEFAKVQFPLNTNHSLVKRIAGILIEMEDYRQAFDYLSRIPVDDENKELLNRIATEFEKLGEIDTAVYLLKFINDNDVVIKEANALREKEMEIHTVLASAELHFSNRRYDRAFNSYVSVLEMNYRDEQYLLGRIVEVLPLLVEDHIDNFKKIGTFFLNRRDYYRAMQFFQQAVEHRPDDMESRKQLRNIFDIILENNSNLPDLRIRSGELYLEEDAIEEAIAEFKHAAQFPEANVDATRKLAIAYIKQREYALAVEAYQAIPVWEIDLENLYDLYLIMVQKQSYPDAHSLLVSIAGVDPNYREAEKLLEQLRKNLTNQNKDIDQDPKMAALIGDVAVGRYQYIEKIGSGGMGVVHKILDKKLNRTVAMKILREGLANSSKAIERFFREARIAATLSHRNIVNIFDYNINQQMARSYISMEFVDGPSLRDIFERNLRSSEDNFLERIVEALFYICQICDALALTHSKGIIHRDIKPDNILVGSDRIAKITDFGIVHIEEASFTPTGAVIGTPRYMAPEQVQGIRIDGRADLYSTGIILYEWLVGTPPFLSGDISYQQVNMIPSEPKEHNRFIPDDVNSMIMRCLEKNPADRYQTAKDLKLAAEQILKILAPNGCKHLEAVQQLDLDYIH